MKTRWLWLGMLWFLILPAAQARMGGGRSFGSRGSRSVAPRTYNAPPRRESFSHPPYGATQPPPPAPYPMQSGGGLLRGLGAGIAGGMLGSLLFRGMGYGGGAGYGAAGGGMGILELLLIAAVIFFGYRWWMSRSGRSNLRAVQAPFRRELEYGEPVQTDYAPPNADLAASDPTDVLRRYDGAFDLARFKEERVDDFFRMQAAFMNRDLGAVKNQMTDEMLRNIEGDIAQLKATGRINRLENIAVRDAEIVEAWQELGKEYATVHLKANLLDYQVDEKTGGVISGSRTEPVKFEEYWTYVRDLGQTGAWRLSAIENTGNA